MTGGGDPDWRLVAAHYEHAERFDEAASAYQQASTDARRRGALAEARTYLTHALVQGSTAPHPPRTETAARSPCGCSGDSAAAAEGNQSRESAADFERCLQLGGTDVRDDELAATLLALTGYYVQRADLRRAAQVLESLRAGLGEGRQWFRLWLEAQFGLVAWLRGEFDAARSHLEQATAGVKPQPTTTRSTRSGSCRTSRSRRRISTWP